MILIQVILRKIIPGNDDLFKFICKKSKVLQKLANQGTKVESKAGFNYAAVFVNIYPKSKFNPSSTPSYKYA